MTHQSRACDGTEPSLTLGPKLRTSLFGVTGSKRRPAFAAYLAAQLRAGVRIFSRPR